MLAVCNLLGLHSDALPDPTTFYYSLDPYAMYVWRALLRGRAQQLRHFGYVALDSTLRVQVNVTVLPPAKWTSCQNNQTTTLTDTASLTVLDVHCCIEREHDTKAGPRAVAADTRFQDWHTEYELTALGVESR